MNGPKTQMMRPTKPESPVEPVRHAIRLSVGDRQIGRVEAWDRATALKRARRLAVLSGEPNVAYAVLLHETGEFVAIEPEADADPAPSASNAQDDGPVLAPEGQVDQKPQG